jgi:phage-related tail protein
MNMSNTKINTENFTQKDLMQHLLNVAQHTATREDLAIMRKESDEKFEKLDSKIESVRDELKTDISKLDSKIESVRDELKADITKLDSKIECMAEKLDSKIECVRKDMNANTWKLLGGLVVIMSVFSFLTKAIS